MFDELKTMPGLFESVSQSPAVSAYYIVISSSSLARFSTAAEIRSRWTGNYKSGTATFASIRCSDYSPAERGRAGPIPNESAQVDHHKQMQLTSLSGYGHYHPNFSSSKRVRLQTGSLI